MSLIAGIDVGGTFTDVAVYDTETGSARTSKVFSTRDQADGLLRGLHQAVETVGLLATVVHGTTVATNAILERKGAKAALITTAGFRDVLELRRRDRPDTYGLTGGYRPLIPRSRCVELGERLDAGGEVVAELDVDRCGASSIDSRSSMSRQWVCACSTATPILCTRTCSPRPCVTVCRASI